MPPTISALPAIAFSRNPIPVQITSAGYISVAGIASVTNVIFQTAIVSGFNIPLVWSAGNLNLLAAVTPDDSGNQFPIGDGLAVYVQSLIPIFDENYYINRDFTMAYALIGGFPAIVFTAKNAVNGFLYNITPVAAPEIAVAQVTAGVNQVIQPNFAHHLEVWLNQQGTFNKIYENNLQLDFPVTGVTTKDLSDVLHPFLQLISDKPSLTGTTWYQCTNGLAAYFLKFGEYYDDAPTVKLIQTTAQAIVNIGGLSVAAALNQTLAGYIRPSGINNQTLCLRQGSKVKKVQPDQPEWLYWLNLTGAAVDIKVRIQIFYSDATIDTFYYAPLTAQAWQKYGVPVGYKQINMNAHLATGKSCQYYTAAIITATGVFLSQTYTYIIDNFRDYPRYFVFLNSLGGYQTLYTWGKGQNATDRTKTDVRKQVTYDVAAVSGRLAETDIRLQSKTTLNTGYTTRRSVTLLKDFLASTEKYFVFEGTLVPIGVNTETLTEAMDGSFLNAGQMEIYTLYDEVVFTDDITLPDDPNDSAGSSGASAGFNAIVDDDNNLDDIYYDDL